MPRPQPFSFATFSLHLQPAMARAHAIEAKIPEAMQDLVGRIGRQAEVSLSSRLQGLKCLLDEEACRADTAGAA